MSSILVKEANKNLFNLSVSKAKTFNTETGGCKAKYKFSYIDKLPAKEWDHHVFGKFNHKILESFHDFEKVEKLEDHILMQMAFKEALIEWKDKLLPSQKSECEEICKQYLIKLANDRKNNRIEKVIDSEREFFININDTVLVKGFIDRVQIDYDGVLHIADYKTTKNPKYLKKDFFQLYTYAWSEFLADPNLEQIRVSYILLKQEVQQTKEEIELGAPKKYLYFQYLTEMVTREKMQEIEDKFLEYYTKIVGEKLFRPTPTPLCDYCDFPEHCPDGKRMMNYLAKKRREKGKPDPPKPRGYMTPQQSNAWAEFGK
jgi:putative RecB family exonuclease